MQQLQKILLVLAVLTLGFSIWYYGQMDNPQKTETDKMASPIPEEPLTAALKIFDVRDFGVDGEEADRMNEYFKDVQQEVSGIIARNETLVVTMASFKTEDVYTRKLYMALSMAGRIKIISQSACLRLQQRLSEATDIGIREEIMRSEEYIVCSPAKW